MCYETIFAMSIWVETRAHLGLLLHEIFNVSIWHIHIIQHWFNTHTSLTIDTLFFANGVTVLFFTVIDCTKVYMSSLVCHWKKFLDIPSCCIFILVNLTPALKYCFTLIFHWSISKQWYHPVILCFYLNGGRSDHSSLLPHETLFLDYYFSILMSCSFAVVFHFKVYAHRMQPSSQKIWSLRLDWDGCVNYIQNLWLLNNDLIPPFYFSRPVIFFFFLCWPFTWHCANDFLCFGIVLSCVWSRDAPSLLIAYVLILHW